MIAAEKYDTSCLLAEWEWLVPKNQTPLFVSVLADWVFGAPDGSLWRLSALEGDFTQIADNANEYNRLNKSEEWLNQTFSAGWQAIAAQRGMLSSEEQCLGWKIHPLVGGELKAENLQVFGMAVYQSLMGQLHCQLKQRRAPREPKRSWLKFWQ